MKGAGVVWLSPDPAWTTDRPPGRASTGPSSTGPSSTGPVWHVWADGACYLLTGPGEQPLPGIVHGGRCRVIARNGAGGAAITWPAAVEALDPAEPEWATVAPKLATGRLNGGDPVAVVPTWPGRLTILRLRPAGEVATAATGMPGHAGSHAAAPQPSTASTPYRMPHGITRRLRLLRRKFRS